MLSFQYVWLKSRSPQHFNYENLRDRQQSHHGSSVTALNKYSEEGFFSFCNFLKIGCSESQIKVLLKHNIVGKFWQNIFSESTSATRSHANLYLALTAAIYRKRLSSIWTLSISLLTLNKAKSFCYILNPFNLINLFFFAFMDLDFVSVKTWKKRSANIQPCWLQTLSITHIYLLRLFT